MSLVKCGYCRARVRLKELASHEKHCVNKRKAMKRGHMEIAAEKIESIIVEEIPQEILEIPQMVVKKRKWGKKTENE